METKTLELLGKCIKHHRILKGLSLEAMSNSIQVSKSTLSSIENGKHSVNVMTYFKILAFLNKTEDQFWVENPITGTKTIEVYVDSKGEVVNPK